MKPGPIRISPWRERHAGGETHACPSRLHVRTGADDQNVAEADVGALRGCHCLEVLELDAAGLEGLVWDDGPLCFAPAGIV